jgi:hypothetical protein
MASEFEGDMQEALSGLAESREEFARAVEGLADTDLRRARRGGWDIGGVVKHVVDSEWHYAGMVAQLRSMPPVAFHGATVATFDTVGQAGEALGEARAALLASLEGVSEEDFYRLRGERQDYSVLSVLQNVRQHDIEHGEQVRHLAETAPPPS